MTDRELLEKAAKAADYCVLTIHGHTDGKLYFANQKEWNPLTDDGDALRLAVKLNLQVKISPWHCDTYSPNHDVGFSENNEDTYAATRRAIVRAAAAIGDAM